MWLTYGLLLAPKKRAHAQTVAAWACSFRVHQETGSLDGVRPALTCA